MRKMIFVLTLMPLPANLLLAQTNPLWHEQKVKNYLPHRSGSTQGCIRTAATG